MNFATAVAYLKEEESVIPGHYLSLTWRDELVDRMVKETEAAEVVMDWLSENIPAELLRESYESILECDYV